MKKIITCILVSMLALCLFAQGVVEKENNSTLRVVSMSPNITETICAIGCENNLVGRTDYCNYPESISSIQSIGTLYEPNLEAIVSLNPDYVIGSGLTNPDFLSQLEKAGIKTYQISEESTLNGTYDQIRQVGDLLNSQVEAENLIREIKFEIEVIEERSLEIADQKTCYYVVGYGDWGDWTATGDTYLNDVIKAAGAINAAEDGTNWSYSKEALLDKDPDVILLEDFGYTSKEEAIEKFITTPGYDQLTACKTGKVFCINADIAERQGPRTGLAVKMFAETLYPEIF